MFTPIILALFSLTAHAEEAKPSLEWRIYGDAYYSYNLNRPAAVVAPNAASVNAAAIPNSQNTYRYYDTYHNQFTLNLVEISVLARMGEVSFLGDFDFGPFADLNAASSGASGKTVDEVSKHVGQAIFTYRPEGSRFSLDLGKMYSHVGAESVKAKDNYNYSRTVLFSYGMPFWHTGLRANYEFIPSELVGSVNIYNGWNSIYDNNSSKSYGAQLKYTPSALVTFAYNFLGGAERNESENDWKTVHEFNTVWTLNRWSVITDLLLGTEKNVTLGTSRSNASWYGGFLAARYNLNDRSYLSPRFELFRDQQGYTLSGGPQTIRSGVLTFGHNLAKGLDLRTEGRWDSSSQKPFSKGLASRNSQTTLLAALLFNY